MVVEKDFEDTDMDEDIEEDESFDIMKLLHFNNN